MAGPLDTAPSAPEDVMFGLSAAYRSDDFPSKVDLGVGAYRDGSGKPWVLPVVQKAKAVLAASEELNHEYLPITGLPEFVEAAQRLIFGEDSPVISNARLASAQTLSGTGALHTGALLLARFVPESKSKKVYVSEPPYNNHLPILQHASLKTASYPYYSSATKTLDLERLLVKLKDIPDGSIILLHACGHNPTGVDPSQEEWKHISQAMKRKSHLPFFDLAYQGFASGDLHVDAWPIRHFVDEGFGTMIVAQSFAKNMGLYGERVGCLHVVNPDQVIAKRVLSQLSRLQRVNVSTPPAFGARIAALILNSPDLFQEWLRDLKKMQQRISDMRHELRNQLEALDTTKTWNHITDQKGMFCFSGLTEEQIGLLRGRFHIYTTLDGRFSMSGLNQANVRYVADSIKAVVTSPKL